MSTPLRSVRTRSARPLLRVVGLEEDRCSPRAPVSLGNLWRSHNHLTVVVDDHDLAGTASIFECAELAVEKVRSLCEMDRSAGLAIPKTSE